MFSGDIETVEIPEGGLELAPGIWLQTYPLGRYVDVYGYGRMFDNQPLVSGDINFYESLRTLFLRPDTTQPNLLERVRELRGRLTDQAEANGQRGRLDIAQLLMEAVDELDCIFPELKDLSAGEQ